MTLATSTHGTVSHHKAIHMVNPYIKFEVSSLSRSGDLTRGVKFDNESRDPHHAPFNLYTKFEVSRCT